MTLIGRILHNNTVINVAYEKQIFYKLPTTVNEYLRATIETSAHHSSLEELGELNHYTILEPVIPSKIICVGRNYVEHAKEFNNEVPSEPIIFFKPPSALQHHKGPVFYPTLSKRVDYEGEIALIIKKKIKKAKAADIADNPTEYYAYTPFLDMTARDIQRSDRLWTRGKGFDTFAPLGPWISLKPLTKETSLKTYVNNELKQHGYVKDMIFPPEFLIEYISQVMTLFPGDVIATGTPSGVGPVNIGDNIKVEIDGLPALEVYIEKEP